MKRIERKKEERTTEEIVKEFQGMGGRFTEFWAGLSLSEREKFNGYIGGLKKQG